MKPRPTDPFVLVLIAFGATVASIAMSERVSGRPAGTAAGRDRGAAAHASPAASQDRGTGRASAVVAGSAS